MFALLTRLALPYLAGPEQFDDLPGLLMRLSQLPVWSVSLIGAVIGALVGGGSLWLMGFMWEKLRGVEAMGLGDVKMMFMAGAYLGWRLTILTIFIASLTGSLAGITVMLYERKRDFQKQLPYGVYLAIGAIVSLFIGSKMIEWYVSQF